MARGKMTQSNHPVATMRIKKGLTRERLANLANISVETIAGWEQGSRKARNSPAYIIVNVAKVLQCKPEELFENI